MRQILLMAILLLTALPAHAETKSVKAQVSGGLLEIGVDYVRLDSNGAQVKVTHTTQTGRQILFIPISEWADHPVVSVLFRPDGCQDLQGDRAKRRATLKSALDQGLITATEYAEGENSIRSNAGESGRLGCLILGTNTVTLPSGITLSQGTWTVLYELNEASRQFVTFRVPSREDTNIEKEVLKKSAVAGSTEMK
ncbi:MAG: hypothetical protein H7Y37_11250 [Anaerolineae bacterium]|nr:hypothetical protein [Gloeobacterales cyanobacterium ES-bin-313]